MGSLIERYDKNRNSRWLVKIRKKGYKLVCKTFRRKTDALNFMRDTESDMDRGIFKYYEATKHTIADMINKYEKQYLNEPTNDYHRASKNMLDWWKDKIGYLYLSAVTPAILAEQLQVLRNEDIHKGSSNNKNITKRTPATVNRYYAALSVAFSKCYEEYEWISENPMKKVKKLKEPKGRTRMLSDEEIKKLLHSCKLNQNPYILPVVCIGLFTGARLNEIMSLTWQDVNFSRETLTYKDTKNGETRTVSLFKPVIPLLIQLKENPPKIKSEYVFPRRDGKAPFSIKKIWNEVRNEALLNDFRFHDLRHSAASFLAMDGANLIEIAEILGHKTLAMVKRYSHLTTEHTLQVLRDMNMNKYKNFDLLNIMQM